MQTSADHLLGWYALKAWDNREHDFYVRQLWDGKASIEVSRLSPVGLRSYGEACGWTLARGHARSGDRFALAAYLGDSDFFDHAIAEFADRYADTNAADHDRLVAAIADGRLEAASDPL
jgi:sugar/nucleoside kinase (ribokinase family)